MKSSHNLAEKYKNIFITGSRGRVGKGIVPLLRRTFQVVEFDTNIPDPNNETTFQGDITDLRVIKDAVRATKPDCIVHLAANANQDSSAEEVVGPNMTGFINVYEAAHQGGVNKIVYASSLHTLSGHPGFGHRSPFEDGRKFSPADPPNPGNPYGQTKVFGENLAHEYYERYGIRTICLRLGDVNDANRPSEYDQFRAIWLSHADAANVFTQAIITDLEAPVGIYFATSDNGGIYDIEPTKADLGYKPLDDAWKH